MEFCSAPKLQSHFVIIPEVKPFTTQQRPLFFFVFEIATLACCCPLLSDGQVTLTFSYAVPLFIVFLNFSRAIIIEKNVKNKYQFVLLCSKVSASELSNHFIGLFIVSKPPCSHLSISHLQPTENI